VFGDITNLEENEKALLDPRRKIVERRHTSSNGIIPVTERGTM
jgi:hypothetical protein